MAATRAGSRDGCGSFLQEGLDKEWKVFHKNLHFVPHSFLLEDRERISLETCRKKVRTLRTEGGRGFSLPLEAARCHNLLAYLVFLLDRPREAVEQTDLALKQDGEEMNLVSLANRACIHWLTGERTKAKEEVRALQKLKNKGDSSYLFVKAKAELAYSYTRLGGRFVPKAAPLFSEVIQEAQAPEVWLWKFGLALTERRTVHMHRVPGVSDSKEDDTLLTVVRTLLEVVDKSQCRSLQAKSYAEVAFLLHGRRGNESRRLFEQEAKLTAVEACQKALELGPEDYSVLWKSGTIFRCEGLLDRSVELLQRSVEARPTTNVFHCLGLTFVALAERARDSKRDDQDDEGDDREDSAGVGAHETQKHNQEENTVGRNTGDELKAFHDSTGLCLQGGHKQNQDKEETMIADADDDGHNKNTFSDSQKPQTSVPRHDGDTSASHSGTALISGLSPDERNSNLASADCYQFQPQSVSSLNAHHSPQSFHSTKGLHFSSSVIENSLDSGLGSTQVDQSIRHFEPNEPSSILPFTEPTRPSDKTPSHAPDKLPTNDPQRWVVPPTILPLSGKPPDSAQGSSVASDQRSIGHTELNESSPALRLTQCVGPTVSASGRTSNNPPADVSGRTSNNPPADVSGRTSNNPPADVSGRTSNNSPADVHASERVNAFAAVLPVGENFPDSGMGSTLVGQHSSQSYQQCEIRSSVALTSNASPQNTAPRWSFSDVKRPESLNVSCPQSENAPDSGIQSIEGEEQSNQQPQLSESTSSLSLEDCTESQCEGSCSTTQPSATIVHTPKSMETSSPVLPVKDHHPQSGAAAIDIGQQSTVQYLQREMRVPQVSSFSRTHAFIQEAIAAYQEAIRLSEQQNVPALYDLALLYRSLGEFDEALSLLDFIQVSRKTTMRPCDRINAYELAGLILKEKSELEEDEEQKRRLNEQGESKLNMALRLCSRLCSRLPKLQPYVRHVWKSFATLFEAAEKSERKTTDKLFEKARLYRLIRDNRQSMALLQEMESITPSKANDPQYLKMWVENYVDLGQYDKALTFIKTLTLTVQGSAMDLFEDDQYVQKVYIQAGRTELLKATTAEDVHRASTYFSEAFSDALDKLRSSSEAQTSSSEDTADESSDKEDGPGWDVMILHEDSATEKAEEMAKVMREACGLRVTRMEEDCPPGRFVLDSLCWTMNRCRQVVIAAGARRVSPQLRLLLERAVKRGSTVSLLVEGTHVPKVAQAMTLAPRRRARDLCCPLVLLEGRGEEEGEGGGEEGVGGELYSEVQVQAVCDVFCFLTDVSI